MNISKVKVMLIQPRSPRVSPFPPMWMGMLGAVLEDKGCEVKLIDGSAPYAGYDVNKILEEVVEFSPHFLGVSTTINYLNFTYSFLESLLTLKKHEKVDFLLVLGGPHPSILPHEVLLRGADVVARGEGEGIAVDLVDFILGVKGLEDILGISYKNTDGGIIDNPERPPIDDLDSLPFPAKHLFNDKHYVKSKEEYRKFGFIHSSRACPGLCTYCSRSVFGRRYRVRSAMNVYLEILAIREKYDISDIRFLDDAFTINKKRLNQLCDLIIEDKNLNIKWFCATRLDSLSTKEQFVKMKEAGCTAINYGVESGSQNTLKRTRKQTTVEDAERAIKWTAEAGISCGANFMSGFPWETVEDIRQTRSFIKKMVPFLDSPLGGGVLIPYPDTDIYEEYKDQFNFSEWWLREDFCQVDRYSPLYKMLLRDLDAFERKFFSYSPEIIREIEANLRVIHMHNLKRYSRRVFKSIGLQKLFCSALFLLAKISRTLYGINPMLEKILMQPFVRISVKYRNIVA